MAIPSIPISVIGRGSISGAISPGITGGIVGQVLRRNGTGAVWVSLTGASEGESVAPEPKPCSFCSEPTSAPAAKYGWRVCPAAVCVKAAEAQAERIYAGLFDSPETRQAALNWVKNRG